MTTEKWKALAEECRQLWDRSKGKGPEDVRLGKILAAMAGHVPGYRADIDELHQAFDFHAHLVRQIAFSAETFGPGMRTKGVIEHIKKELREIEAAPDDIEEWVDVMILAIDGAWRAGATPEQIIAQILAKQAKNEAREWPDWRTMSPDQAIEHVRAEERRDTYDRRHGEDDGIDRVDRWAREVDRILAKGEGL